ncbi:MAG: hypothetical protein ACRD0D_11520, partial [Acidimicrobiales bacterium]
VALLPRRLRLGALRGRGAGVLVAFAGLAGYAAMLWIRFGDPLAFTKVGGAAGWHRQLTPGTVVKLEFLRRFEHPDLSAVHAGLALQAVLTIGALALVPAVVRRFGWAYGAYVVVVVAVPALTSRDFIGMGRYVLVAFPCFAAAASLLCAPRRRALAAGAVVTSGALAALMASLFARWYFLS